MSWLLKVLLDWVAGKFTAFIGGLVRVFLRRKAIEQKEHDSVQPIKDADPKDDKAIDDAAKDALDGF